MPHTFGRALTDLIDAAANGEQMCYRDRGKLHPFDFGLGIRLQGPRPWAEILADGSMGQLKSNQVGRLVYHAGGGARSPAIKDPDMHQERYISFSTIRALAELIRR